VRRYAQNARAFERGRTVPTAAALCTNTKNNYICYSLGRSRRESASLRGADAAQVCSDGSFVVADDHSECSVAISAMQIFSVYLVKDGERGEG
jgi:hypothetical protein